MTSKRFTISIASIQVKSNGDPPGSQPFESGDSKNNAIAVLLEYPRQGLFQLASALQLDLQDQQPLVFDSSSFFAVPPQPQPGLFKAELVEEESLLLIRITMREKPSVLNEILKGIITGASSLGSRPGVSFLGRAIPFLGAVFGTLHSPEPDQFDIIGHAALPLKASDFSGSGSETKTLALIAPTTIHKRWVQVQTGLDGRVRAFTMEKDLTVQGQPNGSITLTISYEDA